jgi:hypothetical protein
MHEFSSTSFISWAHDQHELETEHRYMKKAVYVDFLNGETRSDLIFGTISVTNLEARLALEELCDREAWVSHLLHFYTHEL